MKLNLDSPFMEFMDTTAQFIALNVVFLLCCVPIVTIGPAITALYQVMLRESRGEHGYLVRSFLSYIKENFFQPFLAFLLYAILLLVSVFALSFWNSMQLSYSNLIIILCMVFIFLLFASMLYVFPLMARFQNSFFQTVKNAFLISAVHVKATFILLLLHVTFLGCIYIFPSVRILTVLIGFSFFCYLCSFIFTKVFKQYEMPAI